MRPYTLDRIMLRRTSAVKPTCHISAPNLFSLSGARYTYFPLTQIVKYALTTRAAGVRWELANRSALEDFPRPEGRLLATPERR